MLAKALRAPASHFRLQLGLGTLMLLLLAAAFSRFGSPHVTPPTPSGVVPPSALAPNIVARAHLDPARTAPHHAHHAANTRARLKDPRYAGDQ
jgi:hypothetical protein